MARVLAYAETRNGALRGVAREAVTAARRLADALDADVEVLALGTEGLKEAAADLARFGADRILVAEDEAFRAYHPEGAVSALEEAAGEDCAAVVFTATAQGKELSPRVAARLGRGLATEVTEVSVEDGRPVAIRPVYAGKARAKVAFPGAPALMSVRPNVFVPEERPGEGTVESLTVSPGEPRETVRPVETSAGEKMDVAEAQIVVAGGRGMGDPENWHLLEDLRDALGDRAALGASRAVVDAGWRPHAEQVGQTGKVVSPQLYFAIGISGAIQHLAGMRTSGTIVAVNKDSEAPIFDEADYGIVGDLFEVVPRLTEEIRRVREESA